jgi:hypothetical protein
VTDDLATEEASEPAAADDRGSRRAWVRPVASWVLAVLAAIGITASVLAAWVHDTVLDTDNFIATVSPAIESEAVQLVTADYLSTQLLTALDLENRIAAALTDVDDRLSEGLADALDLTDAQVARLQRLNLLDLSSLAGPIAGGLESRIRDAMTEFVTDPRTSAAIIEVATVAHERTILLLRDELDQLPNIVIDEGQVRLNVVPLLAEALRGLAARGVEVIGLEGRVPQIPASDDPAATIQRLAEALGVDLPPDYGQVALMSEERLQELQDLVRMLDRVVWALVIISIGLSAAAIATAPSVATGAIRVAIGGGIGLLLGLVIVQVIATGLERAAESAEARDALEAVVETLVASLRPLAFVLAITGFIAAAAAYATQRRRPETPVAEEG